MERQSTNEMVVVAIGSSAGGLEALQELFRNIANDLNCAYIVAQHLSPTHKSMMVDLISKVANIPAVEIKNGMLIRPKTIYITPENSDVYVEKNKIYLKSIEQTHGPKPSVNYFFNSLAQAYAHNAIALILSGTGSDGAFGIRAVKANGGITIAQSPESAKYDGMPTSAINTRKVDLVIPIEKMADEMQRLVQDGRKKVTGDLNSQAMQKVYQKLFEKSGVDFSQYKKNTITRRIDRRLGALHFESLDQYLEYIQNHSDEVTNLYHDILIGVTEFFRDEGVFEELKAHIKGVIDKKEKGDEIRFWVIGCSTGEEAYTIAIMLHEILQEDISSYRVKIFATDIDDEALKIARAGVYAETSLTSMDKDLLVKYFAIKKNQFEVKKSLRELVVFSKHNIVSDSPFLRIDCISCRNMLIYFNQNLQERFFSIVHYALKDGGLLLLGKSESIGGHNDLFRVVDKDNKIFKAQYTGTKELPKLYRYGSLYKKQDQERLTPTKSEEQKLEEKLLEATRSVILNQATLINDSYEIIYIKGDIPFLSFAQGRTTNNLFRCLKEELVLDVRTTLNEVQKSKKTKATQFRAISLYSDTVQYARAIIVPIKSDNEEDWFYALFFQSENIENLKGYISTSGSGNEAIDNLSAELSRTKSHLQNVIEELESSYEEVQGLNEELSSSNEELQSSNEELETTNEELQSTNEELQTAYSELKDLYEDREQRAQKLEDLTQRLKQQTEDLRKQKELTEAIIETTPVAIIQTDTDGKIEFANLNAQKVFKLGKKDLFGRTLQSRTWNIKDENGDEVSKQGLPINMIKKSFETVHNTVYWVDDGEKNRVCISVSGAPIFDNRGKFVGAVFSIEDIAQQKMVQEQLKKYEDKDPQEVKKLVAQSFEQMRYQNALYNSRQSQNITSVVALELSKEFKNRLSELLLIAKSLQDQIPPSQDTQKLLESQEEVIGDLEKKVDENIEYYSGIHSYKELPFYKIVDKNLELFESVFDEANITVKNEISKQIYERSKDLVGFGLNLIESLTALKGAALVLEVQGRAFVVKVLQPKDIDITAVEDMRNLYTSEILHDMFHGQIRSFVIETDVKTVVIG